MKEKRVGRSKTGQREGKIVCANIEESVNKIVKGKRRGVERE